MDKSQATGGLSTIGSKQQSVCRVQNKKTAYKILTIICVIFAILSIKYIYDKDIEEAKTSSEAIGIDRGYKEGFEYGKTQGYELGKQDGVKIGYNKAILDTFSSTENCNMGVLTIENYTIKIIRIDCFLRRNT